MICIESSFTNIEKEIRLNEIKELREADNSLSENVEVSYKAFDMSLNS